MNATTRALLTLLAAGATGALLWMAAQLDTQSTDGYWAAHLLIFAGGALLGFTQFRADGGKRPALPLLVVTPALLVILWLLVTADPESNTFRDHFREWSFDLGIAGAVSDIGQWHGVLALGFGLLLGLAASSLFARRRQEVAAPPAAAPAPIEEPVTQAVPEPDPVDRPEPEPEHVTHVGAATASRQAGDES